MRSTKQIRMTDTQKRAMAAHLKIENTLVGATVTRVDATENDFNIEFDNGLTLLLGPSIQQILHYTLYERESGKDLAST